MEPLYDGIAELWWSSEAELVEQMSSGSGKAAKAGAALLEDESTFIDLPNSPLWFAYEYPQINPAPEHISAKPKSNILRVFFPLRQRARLSEEEARHYWLTHHGPIVRSHAEATGTLCYRQVHRANSPLDVEVQKARGAKIESYLGHAEAWVDMGKAPNTDEARRANAAFIADEHNFIDMERSTFLFGKEHDHRQTINGGAGGPDKSPYALFLKFILVPVQLCPQKGTLRLLRTRQARSMRITFFEIRSGAAALRNLRLAVGLPEKDPLLLRRATGHLGSATGRGSPRQLNSSSRRTRHPAHRGSTDPCRC